MAKTTISYRTDGLSLRLNALQPSTRKCVNCLFKDRNDLLSHAVPTQAGMLVIYDVFPSHPPRKVMPTSDQIAASTPTRNQESRNFPPAPDPTICVTFTLFLSSPPAHTTSEHHSSGRGRRHGRDNRVDIVGTTGRDFPPNPQDSHRVAAITVH
jgi:hypothetical protein